MDVYCVEDFDDEDSKLVEGVDEEQGLRLLHFGHKRTHLGGVVDLVSEYIDLIECEEDVERECVGKHTEGEQEDGGVDEGEVGDDGEEEGGYKDVEEEGGIISEEDDHDGEECLVEELDEDVGFGDVPGDGELILVSERDESKESGDFEDEGVVGEDLLGDVEEGEEDVEEEEDCEGKADLVVGVGGVGVGDFEEEH